MVTSDAYIKAYEKLNSKQKEAVDTIYGPVMVIAGPGTGKTQMLALRIGTILLQSTGTKPDEILALTFTESAVATLRTRLAEFIGSAAYRVRIHTFHSFARSILELRPDLFPRIALGTPLSDIGGVALMEQLLNEGSFSKIRSPKNPHRNVRALLKFMGELKQEHYTPERYRKELEQAQGALLADPDRIHEKGKYAGKEKGEYFKRRERIEKHLEAADLFTAYEEALHAKSLYDYEDLIREAIRGLESDEGFRAQVGERSQFILADEHQDANLAQNRLLELVSDFDGAPNLFIVGDEKQSIFRFQGASLSSFFYFKDKYPEAKLISLDENYRSKEAILTAAHELIGPAPVPDERLRPVLIAARGKGGELGEVVTETPLEEFEAICAHIQKLHAEGAPYEDIALLTKKNADVLALSEQLRRAGIPEDHISAEASALTHPAVRFFVSLVRALTDLEQDAPLARALFMPGVPLVASERVRLLAMPRERKPLLEVLNTHANPEFRAWLRRMKKKARELPGTPLVSWLASLASESGFVAAILSFAESEEAYEAYEGLMAEAALLSREQPSATAIDFLERLALIEKHELKIRRARTRRAGVHVMTVHSAKGTEFSHVILARTTDGTWVRGGSEEFSLLLEKEDDEHDERRLLYVALTRAKDTLLVTRANTNDEGRVQTPLRFIADIAKHFTQQSHERIVPTLAPVYPPHRVLDTEFLKERLLARGFSPTGFNNYVQSPWQFYFRTLLQLPDSPPLSMLFGTAVHAGLAAYVDAAKAGHADLAVAVRGCKNELDRLPLLQLDRLELAKHAAEVLRAYLTQEAESIQKAGEAEISIRVLLTVPGVGEVPLTGKLDRLDIHEDGSVTVIDYKTGKAKSENDIRGLTKSSEGGYYRQLVFYKLLLDRDGRYHMRDAALHFVEPDDTGKCIIRAFSITDKEVADLEQELIAAAQNIADGSAFTIPCDTATCDYCDLVPGLTE